MDIRTLFQIYREHPTVTTDSRDTPQGSIFVALRGESFDGNRFALSALEKGCSYAIVDDASLLRQGENALVGQSVSGGPAEDLRHRLLLVPDALQAYKELAREHRRQFRIPVIGITGTNGKTTTKELIASVLRERYDVMATEGNFNNDVGVPKTLLRLTAKHGIAVVEMGASHPGDIRTLVETAEPTCGLITNVGRAHLLGFGSFEGVKRTKGELYDYLAVRSLPAFLNAEDPDLMEMASARRLPFVPYVMGEAIACDPFLRVRISGDTIRTRLIGSYNMPNVLAAVTVGRHFGVPEESIIRALEAYQPSNSRSQLMVTADNSLVVDAYNANPTSMAAAIENFATMDVKQPKMAILGDMRELGDCSGREHQKVADMLKAAGIGEVWLVGEEFGKTRTGFRRFADVEEVEREIVRDKPRGRYILIKGSHGIGLHQLTDCL